MKPILAIWCVENKNQNLAKLGPSCLQKSLICVKICNMSKYAFESKKFTHEREALYSMTCLGFDPKDAKIHPIKKSNGFNCKN